MADAKTGKVTQRLSRSRGRSAPREPAVHQLRGRVGPRPGERVALGAVSQGAAAAPHRRRAHRARPCARSRSPRWARSTPRASRRTGSRVVFSALVGGVHRPLRLRPATRQRCAASPRTPSPTCSPPGRPTAQRIAFVTDRFSTHLDALAPGNYRLAAIDVATGEVRPLPTFAAGKNINPQWAPSGDSLYFLSDARGATNVYRLDLADRRASSSSPTS